MVAIVENISNVRSHTITIQLNILGLKSLVGGGIPLPKRNTLKTSCQMKKKSLAFYIHSGLMINFEETILPCYFETTRVRYECHQLQFEYLLSPFLNSCPWTNPPSFLSASRFFPSHIYTLMELFLNWPKAKLKLLHLLKCTFANTIKLLN